MAKAPSLTDLTSQYSAQSTVNNNNTKIENAFENTLSRDGSSPNQMEADLDMNSNDLLNVNITNTNFLKVGGEVFLPSNATSLTSWEGEWVTSTSYQTYDLVFREGSSYLCLEDHTSDNFTTDLSANKWALLAEKGATGTGSGDLVASNNLSDVDNASTSLSNLGGQPFSTILTTLADDKTLPTYTVTDFDTALESGFIYAGAGALNAPSDLSASAINGFVSRQGDNDLVQVVFGQSITRMYWRLRNAGTWSSWERVMRFSDVLNQNDFATGDPDRPPSQLSTRNYVGKAFIRTDVISSDAVLDLTLDTSRFRSFELELTNVIPATDGARMIMRLSNDGGSTFEEGASAYKTALTGETPFTGNGFYPQFSGDLGSAAGEPGLSGTFKIHNPGAASSKTFIQSNLAFVTVSNIFVQRTSAGLFDTPEAHDAIRILFDNGDLESGEITLFGIK